MKARKQLKKKEKAPGGVDRVSLVNALTTASFAFGGDAGSARTNSFLMDKKSILAVGGIRAARVFFPTGLECSVPASFFQRLVQGGRRDNITLETGENAILVDGVEFTGELVFTNPEVVKGRLDKGRAILPSTKGKMTSVPGGFLDALNLCRFFANRKLNAGGMGCVSISGRDCLATDNYRLAWYKMEKAVKEPMLIPVQSCDQLVKLSAPLVKYNVVQGQRLQFETESGDLLTVLLQGDAKFPDALKVFKSVDKLVGDVLELPEDAVDIIKHVAVLADDPKAVAQQVKMEVEKKRLAFSCEKEKVGKVREWIGFDNPSGARFSLLVNPVLLLSVLKHSAFQMKYFPEVHQVMFEVGSFKVLLALFDKED
jgi:hypothetical protein